MVRLPLVILLAALLGGAAHAQQRAGTPPTGVAQSESPHGAIALACETCHTDRGWRPLRDPLPFDHDRQTGFPLGGRHRQADCATCHLDLRFDAPEATAADCATCHIDVHLGTLGTDCQSCHTPTDFGIVNGEAIHARTAFPLTGSHLQVACWTCHESGAGGALGPALGPLPTDCYACHADDFAATAGRPVDHVAAGFPTTCETCHSTVGFGAEPFDHTAASGGFALVGAHTPLPCSACHTAGLGPLFHPASADDCQSCHADDAARAQPNHTSFPATCTTCHSATTWDGATADHVALSGGFALVGAHATVACAACHSEPDASVPWSPAGDGDCQSCHAADAARALPSHASFPMTCTTCHSTADWRGASVDHTALSGGFALIGAHATAACASCHSEPDYGVPWNPTGDGDCQSCHAEDAAGAEPSHHAFPTTCTTCHSTDTWDGATVDHPTVSGGFALVGAHQSLACAACHSEPGFTVPWAPIGDTDCQACHAEDAATAQPSHAAFPETCTTCHSTASWQGATVDHVALSGGFALVGAHQTLACTTCHSGSNGEVPWTPTSQDDCYACHASDYDAEHTGSGFPTTCLDCHTTSTWTGATFTHSSFPIYSGAHRGQWDTCQTCHVDPNSAAVFTCLTCHEHNQASTDSHHREVNGYVYESTACYSCHPNGRH